MSDQNLTGAIEDCALSTTSRLFWKALHAALCKTVVGLNTQDNRMTANPMFCAQILRRDVGYDADWADRCCWHDSVNDDTVYDDDPDFKEPEGPDWDRFGYVERWETVMVCFTEAAAQSFLDSQAHNLQSRAFRGQTRIYVESFNGCEEMVAIRAILKALPTT